MTDQPDFIDTIIDDMEDTHGSVDFFSTTRVAVRIAIERAIRETRLDHPQNSCEECGHQSDCATHNMPAEKPGRCTCNPFLPDGTINIAAIPPTFMTGKPRGVPMTPELRAMFEKRYEA